MAGALAAGWAAVGIGTRFVAAEEADARPRYGEALLAASSEDSVRTEAFSVMEPNALQQAVRLHQRRSRSHQGDGVGELGMSAVRMPLPRFAVPAATRDEWHHRGDGDL